MLPALRTSWPWRSIRPRVAITGANPGLTDQAKHADGRSKGHFRRVLTRQPICVCTSILVEFISGDCSKSAPWHITPHDPLDTKYATMKIDWISLEDDSARDLAMEPHPVEVGNTWAIQTPNTTTSRSCNKTARKSFLRIIEQSP